MTTPSWLTCGGLLLYVAGLLMQWVLTLFLLAGANTSVPALNSQPPPEVGPVSHAPSDEGGADFVPLDLGDFKKDAHAFLRGTLSHLGYANALRGQLKSHLELWESEGEALAFVLPPVANIDSLDLAYVRERYDIPLEMRPLVGHYVQFFQGAGRKWFVRWLERSTRYVPVMRPIFEKAQLPKDTVYLSMIESGFSPYAYSWAHAAGPWQFIPSTGAHYGLKQDFWVDERRDPIKSTHAAARYLADLYRKKGDWYLAWAGYNAGETRVRRLMERHASTDFWELSETSNLAKETKHYVPKLIAAALMAKHPEAFGFGREEIAYQPLFEFEEVLLDAATDLNLAAKLAGCTLGALQDLNPELSHAYTPPASGLSPYVLRLPKGTKDAFEEAYARLSPEEKSSAQSHAVRKGDTLAKMAATAKLNPEVLAEFNGLGLRSPLQVGQTLLVPKAELFGNPRLQASRPPGSRPPVVYKVRPGDSLWSISRKFAVELRSLQSWNRALLGKNKTLQPGMQLTVWPSKQGRP